MWLREELVPFCTPPEGELLKGGDNTHQTRIFIFWVCNAWNRAWADGNLSSAERALWKTNWRRHALILNDVCKALHFMGSYDEIQSKARKSKLSENTKYERKWHSIAPTWTASLMFTLLSNLNESQLSSRKNNVLGIPSQKSICVKCFSFLQTIPMSHN